MDNYTLNIIAQYNSKADEFKQWHRSFYDTYTQLIHVLNNQPNCFDLLNDNAQKILTQNIARVSEDLNSQIIIDKLLESKFIKPIDNIYWLEKFNLDQNACNRLIKKLLDKNLITHNLIKYHIKTFKSKAIIESFDLYLYKDCQNQLNSQLNTANKNSKQKFI